MAEPSDKQKAYGNYPKGHKHVLGMRISVENAAGSTRKGVDKNGEAWEQELSHDYGYIRGTTGRDKDHVDVFLGPDAANGDLPVHVIDQLNEDGSFDEHKVMLGFADADSAADAYHANYAPGWRGGGEVTPMALGDFKKWAFDGAKKTKPVSELVAFREPERVGYADGGEVKAFFGNPNITRQGKRARVAERSNAADPLTAFASGLLGNAPDEQGLSVLDPGYAQARSVAEPAFWAGTAAQMLPFVGPAVRGVGALSKALSPAAKAAGREILRPLDSAVHGEGALASLFAPAQPAFAVKPKGGNWSPALNNPDDWAANFGNNIGPDVQAWRDKKIPKYIRDYMGTAEDPLRALEKEGRLHFNPEDVAMEAGRYDNLARGGDGRVMFAGDPTHKALTGREHRTPWEAAADSYVSPGTAREALEQVLEFGNYTDDVPGSIAEAVAAHPENASLAKHAWLEKDPEARVWNLGIMPGEDPLQFGHVLDYLQQATKAGGFRQQLLEGPQGMHPFNPEGEYRTLRALVDRGLDIPPDSLSRVSVPDAVRNTSEWNKMLASAKNMEEMNKGVKQVHKQYDTGHQWVELSPEGLQAEGAAMRHCVGGYCSSVEDGSTRILSLRDKEGKPAVTVELRNPASNIVNREGNLTQTGAHKVPKSVMTDYDEKFAASGEHSMNYAKGFDKWLEANHPDVHKELFPVLPPEIQQIKGPANRAPSKEVLSMVQDLVKGGVPGMEKWGRVGDLSNADMSSVMGSYLPNARIKELVAKHYGDAPVQVDAHYLNRIGRMEPSGLSEVDQAMLKELGVPGYASGGPVRAQDLSIQGLSPLVGLGMDVAGNYLNNQPAQPDPAALPAGTDFSKLTAPQDVIDHFAANPSIGRDNNTFTGADGYTYLGQNDNVSLGNGSESESTGLPAVGNIRQFANKVGPADWKSWNAAGYDKVFNTDGTFNDVYANTAPEKSSGWGDFLSFAGAAAGLMTGNPALAFAKSMGSKIAMGALQSELAPDGRKPHMYGGVNKYDIKEGRYAGPDSGYASGGALRSLKG